MKNTKSSIVGELSSGYDAVVGINDYDPEKEEGQIGKAHEEAVAKSNNWESDKHNEIGLPIPKEVKKEAMIRLKAIYEKIAGLEEDEKEYKKDVEEITDDPDIENLDEEETILNIAKEENLMKSKIKTASNLLKQAAEILAEIGEGVEKEALHPAEPRSDAAYEKAIGSPQMGDDEWVDIGSAKFDDKRDEIGKAAKRK